MPAPPKQPFFGSPNNTGGGGGGWDNQQQPPHQQQHQHHQENPSVIVSAVLANDENNENLNSETGFMVSVHRFNQNGQPLSVGEFTQHLVERGCAEDWLLRICDRARRNGEGRVRLYYGNGIQTTVLIANTNNDRMAHLSVGLMSQAENEALTMLPIDDVWEHVQNSQRIVIRTGGVLWGALPPERGRILRVWPRADSPHTVKRMQVVSSGESVATMPPIEEVEETPRKSSKKRKADDGDKKSAAKKGVAPERRSVFGFSREEQNDLAEAFYADWRKPPLKKSKTEVKTKAPAAAREFERSEDEEQLEEGDQASKKQVASIKEAPVGAKETEPDQAEVKEVDEDLAVVAVKPTEGAIPNVGKSAAKKKAPSKRKTQAPARETEFEEETEDKALATSKAAAKKVSLRKKAPAAGKETELEVDKEAANPSAKKKVSAAAKAIAAFEHDEGPEAEGAAPAKKPAAKEKAPRKIKAVAMKKTAGADKSDRVTKPITEKKGWTVFGFSRDEQDELARAFYADWSKPTTKKRNAPANKVLAASDRPKPEEVQDELVEEAQVVASEPAAKEKAVAAVKGAESDELVEGAKGTLSTKHSPKKKEKKASSKKKVSATKKTAEHEEQEEEDGATPITKRAAKKKVASKKAEDAEPDEEE